MLRGMEVTEEYEMNIAEIEYTILPIIFIIMPFVMLARLLFPNYFDDTDGYYTTYKEHKPRRIGGKIL